MTNLGLNASWLQCAQYPWDLRLWYHFWTLPTADMGTAEQQAKWARNHGVDSVVIRKDW